MPDFYWGKVDMFDSTKRNSNIGCFEATIGGAGALYRAENAAHVIGRPGDAAMRSREFPGGDPSRSVRRKGGGRCGSSGDRHWIQDPKGVALASKERDMSEHPIEIYAVAGMTPVAATCVPASGVSPGRSHGFLSRSLAGLLLLAAAPAAMAQVQQTLEMQTGQGGPAGSGPSVTDKVVTLRRNTDNPTAGNTFVARVPAVTVTYGLTNQQFTGLTPAQGFPAGTGGNAVVFGGVPSNTVNMASFSYYNALSTISPASNTFYTSAGNSPATTRIDVAQNAGIEIGVSSRAVHLQPAATRPPTTARVRMADLTLTFSVPVDNPVVYFGDNGAGVGTTGLGYTAEYDLITPGLSLTRLSGNAVFNVVGNSVNNSATTPNANCTTADAAGCGSVRVNGAGITSVTLRIFLRSDATSAAWADNVTHPVEGILIGVALSPISDLSITKTNTPAAGPNDQANDTLIQGATTTYSLVVTNNGTDPVIGPVITDTPVSRLTCPPGNPVTITGSGVPAGSFTVANLTGAGITLGTLTQGQTTTFIFQCTVN